MKSVVIPNVFATSKDAFMERFNKVVPLAKQIQIDFMDGKFVENTSIGVKDIPDLTSYNKLFEAHLMVSDPLSYIDKLKEKGFKKIIFHFESCKNKDEIRTVIKTIKSKKMIPAITIKPDTSVEKIYPYLNAVKNVMFMGIVPGKEKQAFIPSVLDGMQKLRAHNKKVIIQIDGGVNLESAPLLAKAGCNFLNSGSFVGDAKNPKLAIQQLEEAFRKGL